MGRALQLYGKAHVTAQLDHHPTNPGFATLNVIDDQASATAVLVFRLFEAFGLPIQREEAICLYTALSTDTGNFVYKSTNAEDFRIMLVLYFAGVQQSGCRARTGAGHRKISAAQADTSPVKTLCQWQYEKCFAQ